MAVKRPRNKAWLLSAGVILGCWTSASAAPMDALAKKLAAGTASLENKKVAVLTFPYHDDKLSSGSTLLSERLTTSLVGRKVRVLERHLIQQLLEEQKLSETGIIDSSRLKVIGRILDADAIITGTLIDLPGNETELNARLIRTDTGEVLSAGRIVVERSWLDTPIDIVNRAPAAKTSRATTNEISTSPLPNEEKPVSSTRSGKVMKLTNENFAPGRRRYWTPESNRPAHTLGESGNTVGDGDRDDSAPQKNGTTKNYLGYPAPHVGYNGTDAKPLPPSTLRTSPLGTVRTEYGSTTFTPTSPGTRSNSK